MVGIFHSEYIPGSQEELEKIIEAINQCSDLEELPDIPRYDPPMLSPSVSIRRHLWQIQQFISTFQYNHTQTMYFRPRKRGGVKHVCALAKEIIAESLPIQCVEAVFLAVYLTQEINDLQRIPVFFRSFVEGRIFKHIILAVRHGDKWGALGLSRRKSLMYKDLSFNSFADLIHNFKNSYIESGHHLLSVKVGFTFDHNNHSIEPLRFKVLKVPTFNSETCQYNNWNAIHCVLNQYVKDLSRIMDYTTATGKLPENFSSSYALPLVVEKSVKATPLNTNSTSTSNLKPNIRSNNNHKPKSQLGILFSKRKRKKSAASPIDKTSDNNNNNNNNNSCNYEPRRSKRWRIPANKIVSPIKKKIK